MFVKFTSADRVPVAVNAAQISFISCMSDGTRIRFGEGRSVTVIEPLDEVMERLNQTRQLPDGNFAAPAPVVAEKKPRKKADASPKA